ncbi:MAG: TolC family protein [Candidatus Firestonebacteria bacterium]
MKRIILLFVLLGMAASQENRLTLADCVETAFKNSVELKISEENLKQAGLNKIINFAPFYPAVNLSISDKLLGFDDNGLDIPFLTVNPDTYSASLSVSYNIYNMYKDFDQYRYSERKYEESELAVTIKKQELAYSVIVSYYEVLASEKNLQIRSQALEQKKEYLKLAESLYKAGIKAKSDYLNALIQIKKSEILLRDAETSLKISKAGLNTLLGTAPDKELVLAEDNVYGEYAAEVHNPPVDTYDKLLKMLFESNFEWRKLKLQCDYTFILTALSERALWPSLSIDGSYSLSLDSYARSSSEWTNNGRLDQNSTWGISMSLSYPLFDGEANYSRYKSSKAALDIAGLNIEKLKRELLEEIYSAFLNVNRIYGELELFKIQVELAKENLELIKNRYQSGISSFLDLIDAELNYTAAEIGYYQAIYDYKKQEYSIEKQCGVKLFWK